MKLVPLFTTALFILTACATLPTSAPVASEWQLIDNFESGKTLEGWTVFDAQNDTDPYVPNAQISDIRTETAGSDDAAPNHYMLRKPAADGIVGNRKALAWKSLPTPIPVGETATIFTRINVEYFPNNHAFGISNQSDDQIGALAYDAFEPMLRVTDKAESDGTKNDGTLMVLLGGKTYANIDGPQTGIPAKPLEPGTWYELWYIVDNGPAATDGQSYDLYIKGGEFTTQTRVYEDAKFRVGREQPLTIFMAITNTGPAKSPYGNGGVRYDDIYMAKGEVLSRPE